MHTAKPDVSSILDQLKDFQRDTVEYVFRRMYLDPDCVRRFLVADEVGLGKTLVARGLIAKTIDYLWDRTARIDIVYVCSNAEIARQNINRLNITGHEDFTLSSRITLLPITLGDMTHRRVNFVSFTPGTSFDLKNSPGRSKERELLYWLLAEPWAVSFNKATCVLQAGTGIYRFRTRVKHFRKRYEIHPTIAEQFAERLQKHPHLREQFDALCEEMPRAGAHVPPALNRERNQFIGELRRLLAQTCLHWLEPDLIILDEFQRFKHLLGGGNEGASEAAQLAEHLFNFQQHQSDPATAARVVLLSATPYKMYTLRQEHEHDDHYEDFRATLNFLLPDESKQQNFHAQLHCYREEMYRLAEKQYGRLLQIKAQLENALRRVMVRTERLAVTADRNGMLVDVPPNAVTLSESDVRQYLALQRIARTFGNNDVIEYWKSAPYLLNFMDDYDFKRKVRTAIDSNGDNPELSRAMRFLKSGLLQRKDIERYQQLDPGNARLRALHQDTIEREAWRLLWIPPSLPYYQGKGPFADPRLVGFTKRLVFSCWRVVPKAIASILSYEAERCMMQQFRRGVRNTAEARKRRRPLLRFTFSKGRPNGMPALGLVYPSRTLAELGDPRRFAETSPNGSLPTLDTVTTRIGECLQPFLSPLIGQYSNLSEPPDERWYWVAPLLLDEMNHGEDQRRWFSNPKLAEVWSGDTQAENHTAARGWRRHVHRARQVVKGRIKLGRPPEDLERTLALLAMAGPGVAAWRALGRVVPQPITDAEWDLRTPAASLAYAFLHLFNLPEVVYMLRDREKTMPYWHSVLEYCAAGNLQSVLDEYVHLLVESLGLIGQAPEYTAEKCSQTIQRSLTLRTATVQADVIKADKRRVQLAEPLRLRTRFAMRFGDQESDDGSDPTRADHVRAAFNSPFWPFVLATTSVGQEGLDFHPFCHAVVHWNLPSNPVDLEQREGRVHRYKGHALRKNIAAHYRTELGDLDVSDPWTTLFEAARRSRPATENDLFPYWTAPNCAAQIERHIPALPHSREMQQQANLRRTLVLYRMVFGQNRQEDLLDYLSEHLSAEEVDHIARLSRIDLAPPRRSVQAHHIH